MSTLHNRAAEAAQRSELRRAILLSAALHVVIGVAFYFAPPLVPRSPEMPGIITVDLVALPALAGAAAPRAAPPPPPAPAPPAPIPEAPPPPKPPPPPKREVVIPETPKREAKPKPKEPPKPRDPPKPKPERRPEPPPPATDADVEYDDLLAELRAERGETVPRETARADAPAPAAAPGGGGTTQVSPEVARWLRQADRHVKRFWVVPLGLQDAPLVVHLDVKLDPVGAVQGEPRITKRSGNPWFDEGAVRAVQKASPLPAPPKAGTWPFVFRPEDLD